MRKSGVAEKYVRVVQDMYERSRTVVRCAVVMDQLSEEVRQESPWTMMFADDIVICSESREQVEENLERWRFALERRGMKVSRIQSNGECGNEKISARIKGKVYRTVVRPAMLYGLETVSLRKRQESELEVAELKMLREARLRWFGHVQRRDSEDSFELHSVDLELEAVEKQIRDLQVKQAQLRQRKATLESSRTDAHLSQAQRTKDAACPGFVHSGAGVTRSLDAAAAEDASQAPGEDLSPSAATRTRNPEEEHRSCGPPCWHERRETEILKKDFRSLVEKVKEQKWKVHGHRVFGVLGCLDALALPPIQVTQLVTCIYEYCVHIYKALHTVSATTVYNDSRRRTSDTAMDFRGLLQGLKNWTLGEIACAAGLVTLSAGAGYCISRLLRRERAPPDHTQPPQVDICRDIFGMMRGPESRLCWFETAETHCLTREGFPYYTSEEESFTGIQFVEPNIQLLPTEQHQDPSPVLLPLDAGELISACRNIQFLSADPSVSQFESVYTKTYFLGMIRGPQSRHCWFKTTKTCSLNHMGFPYQTSIEDCFTGIQAESGKVTEFISCNRVETSFIVPHYFVQTITTVNCTYLYVAEDGQMYTSTWEYDQNDSEECLNPEEMEVPFICCHFSDRGVTEIGLKVPALREAFATLLASIHNQNFLFVVGKKIVMRLAAANNQDAVGVQLAYEALIQFLRTPSNQESIKAELSSCDHHYNFLDVFYELIFFSCFINGSKPQPLIRHGINEACLSFQKFKGGFLERLLALISMWDVDVWEPAAELYFTVLVDHLTQLAEVLFTQPLELYSDPAALATAVQHHLKQHVQQMMDILEKL
ncbi:hypothetical protein QTP86_008867 [Hemibagrus guttatus]|nr:hypothetical protein QTP86_008867 [Hemibagrus guttatus]